MSLAQLEASDPNVSAFVSAHAGTGKTKLLIDRLLRLMLAGADPARILCLTYTKAAAAEMAIRLQKRLGEWVTLSDAALSEKLQDLLVPATEETRAAARALFGKILDLPGGMRIATIHAFCQSLLKRFPLEAQISPHFQLVDTADARAEFDDAREKILPITPEDSIAALAGLVNAEPFSELVQTLQTHRARLEPVLALPHAAREAALRRALGVTAPDEAAIIQHAVTWPGIAALRAALETVLIAPHATERTREKADSALAWLNLPEDARAAHWAEWINEFFRPDGEPRGLSIFANKKVQDQHKHIIALCEAEQARIETVRDQCRALRMAAATASLLRLAEPVLTAYEAAKHRRALLDYADLITRTGSLLRNSGAAWVLFKLDGGLDHVLLDEVQDTAPAQWEIADLLTADFFTGDSARETSLARTIFAVGDRKQSIYSFQGANPEEFDRWRQVYQRRVRNAGLIFRPTTLDISYRSTPPVLALVDQIFAGSVEAEGTLQHIPFRAGQAGRIELWPPAPRPAAPGNAPWSIPAANQARTSAPQTLVNHLAAWIARTTSGTETLASENRPVCPGDILILVRRRGDFDRALVSALKTLNVPVAGLDRMTLTQQPAVQDLLALCDALLLPNDDLSFAEMLVSPIGGLSDDSLMQLAAGRTGTLAAALHARAQERPEWEAAYTFFTTLLGRADYAPPHTLLSEALGALGARARLFARLGPEAAEPIDELLNAALVYAASNPPSLQGFVHWLRQSAADLKREPEAASNMVRIMTVHAAKGLEAPIVILPDTTGLPPAETGLAWTKDPQTGIDLPLWQPNKAFSNETIRALRDAGEEARLREYNRLLYVALTRARDWLIICGWELARASPGNWHERAAVGMALLGAQAMEFSAWPGNAWLLLSPQAAPPASSAARQNAVTAPLPAWAGTAPLWRRQALPPEPAMPRPLAPSRPDGILLGPVPPARSPLQRTAASATRGVAMHALLQHLPDLPPAQRETAARQFLATIAGLEAPDRLASQALALLDTPSLAPLFGPQSRAEQPLSGVVAGQVITGQVDRLAILDTGVMIADYKTSRLPPLSEASVPVLYLRQMAAYQAILAALYPGRPITCLLIWTETLTIMTLPPDLLALHAPGKNDPSFIDPSPRPTMSV